MSRLPIRVRLTLVFRARDGRRARRCRVVRLRARELRSRQRTRPGSPRPRPGPLGARRRAGARWLDAGRADRERRVLRRGRGLRDGRVLDATPPIGRKPAHAVPSSPRAQSEPVFAEPPFRARPRRAGALLALPGVRDGQQVVLVVGATRENRAETLSSLRAAFLIGGPIALVLAALGGYLLAGAALRPIESMRRRAADISATSLDERLPVPPARRRGRAPRRDAERDARPTRGRPRAGAPLRRRREPRAANAARAARRPSSPSRSSQVAPSEELRAAIDSAAEETDRLTRIADDLLLLARAEQGGLRLKTEQVDVIDVLEDVAGRFRTDAGDLGRPAATPLVVAGRPAAARAGARPISSTTPSATARGAITVVRRRRERHGRAARASTRARASARRSSRRRSSASRAATRAARGTGAASASRSSRRSRAPIAARLGPRTRAAAARTSGFRSRSVDWAGAALKRRRRAFRPRERSGLRDFSGARSREQQRRTPLGSSSSWPFVDARVLRERAADC